MITSTDLNSATWRKSSYSNGSGGNCVEVADAASGPIRVRDSKSLHRPPLLFPPRAWARFLAGPGSGCSGG